MEREHRHARMAHRELVPHLEPCECNARDTSRLFSKWASLAWFAGLLLVLKHVGIKTCPGPR